MRAMDFGRGEEVISGATVPKGKVLTLSGLASIRCEDGRFCIYSDPECTDLISVGSKELISTVKLIKLLSDEGAFDSLYAKDVDVLLLYSYVAELLGEHEEFWEYKENSYTPNVFDIVLRYLEDTVGLKFGAAANQALFTVKSMHDWPVGRVVPQDKIRATISVSSHNAAMLGFSSRAVTIEYTLHGKRCKFFVGFPDYNELDTDTVGSFDWYSACWKRLVYFVLNACGIRSNAFSFFFADGVSARTDYYTFDGQGVVPQRVTCMEQLHRVLDDYLEVYRKDKKVYE